MITPSLKVIKRLDVIKFQANYFTRKIAKNTIPSIRAARMIDKVRIDPAAEGFLPVASAALEPRRPIPIAEPIAARATCKLPLSVISEIIFNIILVCLFVCLFLLLTPTVPIHGQTNKSV